MVFGLNGAQLLVMSSMSYVVRQLRSSTPLTPIGVLRFSGTDGLGIAYVSRYSSPPCNLSSPTSDYHRMRWLFSFTVAFVWAVVVQAKSFTGDRLLVVLEDQAEREKYSVFLEDLTCKY